MCVAFVFVGFIVIVKTAKHGHVDSFRLDLHLPEGGSTHTPATQQMAWLAVRRGYNFDPLGLFLMKIIEN